MKKLLFISTCIFAMSFTIWQPNFETAKQQAREKNQLILLNFSGSDWCGPCIRMKREILEDSTFSCMADTSLIMINADFPRSKKHQLAKEIQKNNEALADKYNPEGKFPFTLLLDANGKILKSWDGMPNENVAEFTQLIKNSCDAYSKR
ncbi:MAG TPA: thioredoxin family protein [Ferruginibacter sp.]|nr:thioredoxin family protein [Ferruginibacter sp.]